MVTVGNDVQSGGTIRSHNDRGSSQENTINSVESMVKKSRLKLTNCHKLIQLVN